MANTLLTPDIIAREALVVLENNLVMANLVHRDYSAEFAQVGDTVMVRKPPAFVAHNFTDAIITQDATEGSVAVRLDRHRDVSFTVTSKELTLDISDFSEQLIQPAMRAVAQAIDQDLLNEVANVSASVTATASPTNLADIASLSKTLDLAKVPLDTRRLVLHPTHKYRYALTDNLSKVAYAGNGQTLRNAELGRVYTLDTYMDQNAPDTLATTAGSATSYRVTGSKDGKTIGLSSLSGASATVKAGDGFILEGRLYRFTEDGTGNSSAIAEIAIDMPLLSDYTAAEVYAVRQTHSLAFHKNALALVTRPLSLPLGAAKAAIINDRGMGVRVVYQYNSNNKKDTISLDILYGIKTLDASMAVKLIG